MNDTESESLKAPSTTVRRAKTPARDTNIVALLTTMQLIAGLEEVLGNDVVAYIASLTTEVVDRFARGDEPPPPHVLLRLAGACHAAVLLNQYMPAADAQEWFQKKKAWLAGASPARTQREASLSASARALVPAARRTLNLPL